MTDRIPETVSENDELTPDEMFQRWPASPEMEAKFRQLHENRAREAADRARYEAIEAVVAADWDTLEEWAKGDDDRAEWARWRFAMEGADYARVRRTGKRGRPEAWHRGLQVIHGKGDGQSDRTRQNDALANFALQALFDDWDPSFAWFWRVPAQPTPDDLLRAATKNGFRTRRTPHAGARWTVLIELGRLGDGESILDAARALVKWPIKSTNDRAVEELRKIRLNGSRRTPNANEHFAKLADRLRERGVSWEELSYGLHDVGRIASKLGDAECVEPDPEAAQRVRVEAPEEPRVRVDVPEEEELPLAEHGGVLLRARVTL